MSRSAPGQTAGDSNTYQVAAETYDFCIEEYISLTADAWAAKPLEIEIGRSGLVGQSWQIGPCMLTAFDVGPFIRETTPAHLQKQGPLVALERYVSGFEYSQFKQSTLDDRFYAPGPIQICAEHVGGTSIGTALRSQEIYIPNVMIGVSTTRPVDYAAIYSQSMIGGIVHAEWDAMFEMAVSGQSHVSKQMIHRFAACIKIALGVHPQREDVRAEARDLLRRQIQRFIVLNLGSPDLSTRLILETFGLSRASLYRGFEALGGLKTYISHLRASKALLEVWQAGLGPGSVSVARARWGFSTGNDFNRTVRRLFGNSPKRLLSTAQIKNPLPDLQTAFAKDFFDARWRQPEDPNTFGAAERAVSARSPVGMT
ncbi:MAG: AraC family transcriptional regulator [Pseudomonadota bacterium]